MPHVLRASYHAAQRAYVIYVIGMDEAACQLQTSFNLRVPVAHFPDPPHNCRLNRLQKRLPVFPLNDGTDLIGWLLENLKGGCELLVWKKSPERERAIKGMMSPHDIISHIVATNTPMAALNFTHSVDAVNFGFRFNACG